MCKVIFRAEKLETMLMLLTLVAASIGLIGRAVNVPAPPQPIGLQQIERIEGTSRTLAPNPVSAYERYFDLKQQQIDRLDGTK